MPTENSELDSLAGMAAEADGAASAAAPGAEVAVVPEGPNYATEAAGAVDMLAALFVGYCPSTATVWTAEKKQHVAMAMAPVMEKYNFSMGAMPPEIILLVMAGPPLYQTAKLMAQQRIDEAKAAKQAEAGAPVGNQAAASMETDPNAVNPGVHDQVKLYQR